MPPAPPTAAALLAAFTHNARILGAVTAGLDHDDATVRPQPGGNTMHWNLGHLALYRDQIAGALGAPTLWEDADAAPYRAKQEPAPDAEPRHTFETLLTDFGRMHEHVCGALEAVAPGALAAPHGDLPLGEWMQKLHWHELYHLGQMGLLRRLAGKPGFA